MRRFWRNAKGNIAVLFALAIVPIIGGVGAAVDYSLAAAYRTDLQKALDSTALALAKMMPVNQQTLDTVGMQYLLASLGPNTLSSLTLTITPTTGHLKLDVTGQYTPQVASLLGIGTFPVGARSEAKWSIGKVEIALVLDVSLSMSSLGRIEALRQAVNDLINVLEKSQREPGDAKLAFAPFDGNVNTGYTYATAPTWIRFDYWDATYGSNVTTCTGSGSKKTCTTNWVPESRSNWAGCLTDRDQSNDVQDTAPTGNATNYPAGKCYSTPPQAVTPLSSNWAALRTKANALNPTGYTNITIGLVWGWHLLSSTAVYTEGVAYNTPNVTKYVILMTDGDNSRNRWTSCSIGSSCPAIDARTSAVCTNIKASGIKVYTVRLIEGNADLIRNCATNTSMYYEVQQASQLSAVFSAIGAEIASLHLSK